MPSLPIGYVPELAPDDKVPGNYLKSITQFGSSVGTQYLFVCGAAASSGANITAGTQVVDILTEADALYWAGANSEGYRMLMRALSVGGVKIKYGTVALTATPTAATATITIDGTWTTTGSLYYRLGGRAVGPVNISAADTVQGVANAIAAYINADPLFPATAAVASGAGTTYIITLTTASQGTRSNGIIIWQDTTKKPSGLTSTLGGSGDATTSGGKYFAGGSGTESSATLLATTWTDEFFTNAISFRDSTNLGLWETQINNKLSPLEGRLEAVVTCAVGTLAASGSLAQSTLNNQNFQMLWLEETETPGEELAALHAAQRHQLEIIHPNRRYNGLLMPDVQAQEAPTKRPSRATLVAALNYGLTPLETRNDKVFCVRAVTTRTQTDGGDADNGTIDVAQDRVAKETRRRLKLALDDHMVIHPYLVEDPAEGDEPDVPADNTYPKKIASLATELFLQLQKDNWLSQVEQNLPKCGLNPLSATARAVVFAPIVPKPLFHQTEGTVALRKFQVAAAA